MSTFTEIINQSEGRFRKHWLLSTACFVIFCPLVLFAFRTIAYGDAFLPKHLLFVAPITYIIRGVICLMIIWHCAYRKCGTKLLTFLLIVCPFKILSSIQQFLKKPFDVWDVVILSIEIALFLWWFLLSLKMKTVNKAIQGRMSIKNTPPKGQQDSCEGK